MRIAPEHSAAAAAQAANVEATTWIGLARAWTAADHAAVWDDVPGTEQAVVGLYDPTEDLRRRMLSWGYRPGALDLSDVARFAAGLARAEADGWSRDEPHLATRAYADRRFLLGDRILPWAVPWLEMVASWYPDRTDLARHSSRTLLELGDAHRPAPALTGTEGLVVPGFDGFGPIEPEAGLPELVLSLWSGAVLCRPQLAVLGAPPPNGREVSEAWLGQQETRRSLAQVFRESMHGWERLAADHPGSRRLWLDLAGRARRTASQFDSEQYTP